MTSSVKGTTTSLSSYFPAEEAQRAAKRVQDAIRQRQKELSLLHQFITDNTQLVNLVQKLPDEISYDIMVPFGRAAFFPGRLIHTNELLVLLGDGYYAERTAKQTVDILQRRERAIESQVDSIKVSIKDLQAEASFFDNAATEAAEGIVEIREDYIEEPCSDEKSKAVRSRQVYFQESSDVVAAHKADEDDQFARIMSRLDELEKEEQAAILSDEDESDNQLLVSKGKAAMQGVNTEEELGFPSKQKKVTWADKTPRLGTHEGDMIPEMSVLNIKDSEDEYEDHPPGLSARPQKGIIGSIVEHQTNTCDPFKEPAPSQVASSQTSKPVSRFKLQRGKQQGLDCDK